MLAFCLCLDLSTSAPLARYACSWGWQNGGGLYIWGTATLTNTNVYANQADEVCSSFALSSSALSSSAPLERYVCSWLAVWRGTLHLGHGNAVQHQRIREPG